MWADDPEHLCVVRGSSDSFFHLLSPTPSRIACQKYPGLGAVFLVYLVSAGGCWWGRVLVHLSLSDSGRSLHPEAEAAASHHTDNKMRVPHDCSQSPMWAACLHPHLKALIFSASPALPRQSLWSLFSAWNTLRLLLCRAFDCWTAVLSTWQASQGHITSSLNGPSSPAPARGTEHRLSISSLYLVCLDGICSQLFSLPCYISARFKLSHTVCGGSPLCV